MGLLVALIDAGDNRMANTAQRWYSKHPAILEPVIKTIENHQSTIFVNSETAKFQLGYSCSLPLLIEKGNLTHHLPPRSAPPTTSTDDPSADPAQRRCSYIYARRQEQNHSRHQRRSPREFGWFEFHLFARARRRQVQPRGPRWAKIPRYQDANRQHQCLPSIPPPGCRSTTKTRQTACSVSHAKSPQEGA